MGFGIALSGIHAAQTDLDVTSNNIANSQTTGFKQSRSQFSELFALSSQGVSNTQTGTGVAVSAVAQQFSQGNINSTNNSLDLAISGQGFFVVRDAGATLFTRSGAFGTDKDGFVVNASGQKLQVYPTTSAGSFNTTATQDLRLVTSDSAPQATSNAEVVFNLPANAPLPEMPIFDPGQPNSFNQSTSITVYDSLGAAHTASLYFVKQATPNTWQTHLYIDGNAVGTPKDLVYSSAGSMTTPASGLMGFETYTPDTGALPIGLTLNVSKCTQYGTNFNVTSVSQDGFTTGRLLGMTVDSTGVVGARFSNGRSTPLGAIAIANFANPQGLQSVGGNAWSETYASGQRLNGQAGNSGFGTVQSGALEQSNVDITQQLVNMITAQRNFQANAQMIQTQDQIQQTIIQIR